MNEMVLNNSQYNIFRISIIRHVSILARSTIILIKINLVENHKMDPRVREVVEGAMNNCNNEMRSLEPLVDSKMGSVLDACFSKNSSNPDRFADCILEKNKRVEEIMKSIEFKVLYYSKAANNCLLKKSVGECTEETTRGLKEVIEGTKRVIEKL